MHSDVYGRFKYTLCCTTRIDTLVRGISSRLFSNSEADASELLKRREEMSLRPWLVSCLWNAVLIKNKMSYRKLAGDSELQNVHLLQQNRVPDGIYVDDFNS